MKTKRLGKEGPAVSTIGLGLMGMSDFYGRPDEGESSRVIHAAIERGVTLLDTGDFYGMGHNELLLGRALRESSKRDQMFVQVKFGALRSPEGAFLGFDGRPAAVKNAVAQSLNKLGVDHIDLVMPARVDPAVPIEDTVGALKDLVESGWVRHIGLSEVGVENLKRAREVAPIVALQREYSLITRELEDDVLPALEEMGAGLTAYGVLSRGLLSGKIRSAADVPADYRSHLPRFTGENLEKNLAVVERLVQVAEGRGVTPSQLAIAWVASRSDTIVPLIGARTMSQLDESLAALEIELAGDEIASLEEQVAADAIRGERYDTMGMQLIGS
ncbi:MAG: aldo/keto reductase [Myxococcota bacterium]